MLTTIYNFNIHPLTCCQQKYFAVQQKKKKKVKKKYTTQKKNRKKKKKKSTFQPEKCDVFITVKMPDADGESSLNPQAKKRNS